MAIATDALALVARTRAAQGLPLTVSDPAVLALVAGILLAGRPGPKDEGALSGPHATMTTARKSRCLDGT